MNFRVQIDIRKQLGSIKFDSLKSTHKLIKFNYFALIIMF